MNRKYFHRSDLTLLAVIVGLQRATMSMFAPVEQQYREHRRLEMSVSSLVSRKRQMLAVVVSLVALCVGGLAGLPPGVTPAHAQGTACQVAHGPCSPGDDTLTAAAVVSHYDVSGMSPVPVEPDTATSWTITTYWNTNVFPCEEITQQATVDVTWDSFATAWGLSNIVTTANIDAVDVCSTGDCTAGGTAHGWQYKLFADIDAQVLIGAKIYNLRQVVFATTSISNGHVLNLPNCTLGSAVTPNSQTYSVTDNAFDCNFNYGSANGPGLTIQY
jgi:hypothetical protein